MLNSSRSQIAIDKLTYAVTVILLLGSPYLPPLTQRYLELPALTERSCANQVSERIRFRVSLLLAVTFCGLGYSGEVASGT